MIKVSKKLLVEIIKDLKENELFDSRLSSVLKQMLNFQKLSDDHKNKWFKKSLFLLSTSRNRLLITENEQELMQKKVIAFFGLSVGSHAVSSWMMESRADCIKISDPDYVSTTNLNRLNSFWLDVGNLKVKVVEDKVLNFNPFCKVLKFNTNKIQKIKQIILAKPKTDLIVEQIDNLEGKVMIRKIAREAKIPVVMATDVGDNVFIDIERYDLDQNTKMFDGRIDGIEKIDISKLSKVDRIRMSVKLVGLEHNSERMMESLMSIGRDIKTWPQLGSTAMIAGGIIAKVARKILLNENIKTGRYYFPFEENFVAGYNGAIRNARRLALRKNILSK